MSSLGWWTSVHLFPSSPVLADREFESVPTLVSTRTADTLRLPVGGEVQAADTITVRSQAAGRVSYVGVQSGTTVTPEVVVVRLDAPVTQAELALRGAERTLAVREGVSQRAAAADQAAVALVSARTAAEVADVTALQQQVQVVAAYVELHAVIRSGVQVVPRVATYVDANRSLFTARGLMAYRSAVAAAYGAVPTYLEPVRYVVETNGNLLAHLETLAAVEEIDPLLIETAAFELWQILENLAVALESGEERVVLLPRGEVISVQADYFAVREIVRTTQRNLTTALHAVRLAEQQSLVSDGNQSAQVVIQATQAAALERQADIVSSVTAERARVATAAEAVAAAAVSLSEVRSGQAGVVGGAVVRVGEYVTPGTPLFTLYGAGARELTVYVPIRLAKLLAVGVPLQSAGETLGTIDRWSPGNGGVVQVTIVVEPSVPLGTFIQGELALPVPADWYSVPVSALEHTQTGPAVRLATEVWPVTPRYVTDAVWFFTSDRPLPASVAVPAGFSF